MNLLFWEEGVSFFLFLGVCVSAHVHMHVSCVCDGPVATWIEKGPNLSLLTLHPTSTASLALWVIYSYAGADETTG